MKNAPLKTLPRSAHDPIAHVATRASRRIRRERPPQTDSRSCETVRPASPATSPQVKHLPCKISRRDHRPYIPASKNAFSSPRAPPPTVTKKRARRAAPKHMTSRPYDKTRRLHAAHRVQKRSSVLQNGKNYYTIRGFIK